ncbi:hypothetical protein [Cronobacter dublinensis]|uniref:hypothetical protein n=1 Tax=Cronobacter dublinensis TaxID=413497 RepID=UPI00300DF8DC
MMLLQLSAAQGPDECCLAVSKALEVLRKEAARAGVALSVTEEERGPRDGTLRSVLISLDGEGAPPLAQRWCGTLQWIAHKLEAQREAHSAGQKAQRWLFHHQIARGNPTRCFKGMDFTPVK